MKEISNFNKIEFKSWKEIRYEGKEVSRWWGKTYFHYDKAKGKLFTETFSPIGRILHRFFGYKKEFNKANLWGYLADKKIVKGECPKDQFREVVGKTLGSHLIPAKQKEDFFTDLQIGVSSDKLIEFLKKIPDVNGLKNEGGRSVLWMAVFFGRAKVVEYLLQRNVDVNADKEYSALRAAVNRQKDEVALDVLESGGNVDDNEKIVLALLEKGADVNAKDSLGSTVLHAAIANLGNEDLETEKQSINILEAILKRNPEVNVGGHHGDSPLYRACEKGNLDAVKMLITQGAEVNFYGKGGKPPIYGAIQRQNFEVARFLIEQGAQVNFPEAKELGWLTSSPLPLALERKAPLDLIKLLVEKGADVKELMHDDSLLHIAAKYCDKECVEYLVNQGLDVNARDSNGQTPLYHAIGKSEVAELLLKHHADVNITPKVEGFWSARSPFSLLHLVALIRDKEIIKTATLLLDHGADFEKRDPVGQTPLFLAASEGNTEVVKLFLARGANPNTPNNEGKTPLQIAREHDSLEIIELLESQNTK